MSDYRKRFDERLPQLEGAIKDMPGSLGDLVPGLTKERIIKLLKRISVLLGRLDSKGAKHPQYLWMNGVLSPESIIGQVDSIIGNSASGASSLVQNHLPSILSIYDSLEKSIGTDASEMRALLSSVNSDLSVAVSQTDELSTQAQLNVENLLKSEAAAKLAQQSINQLLEATRNDAAKADAARRTIETLTNPDGRNKNSLEALARKARERFAEIEDIFKSANSDLASIQGSLENIEQLKLSSDSVMSDLNAKKEEAEQILNLSSQAGLASSYQSEKNNLGTKILYYNGILYASSVIAFIVAVCYVVPSLGSALSSAEGNGQHIDFWKAFSFTLLRASVLSPLVYVIYFTQKTLSSIELLRMDYAEKSAASLAYSGYKDQMEVDPDLLKQLQASLLMKFSEHPERLLHDGKYHSKARVKTVGFEAEAETSSGSDLGN